MMAARRPSTGSRGAAAWAALAIAVLAASGCHHQESARVAPQALPPGAQPNTTHSASGSARIDATPLPAGGISDYDLAFIAGHPPILSEVGYATWYSAPYKGRRSANGQPFDNNALTAAQRTLPMGSLIVVTNLKTGQSSAMRISDRGPFVGDRMIDLTMASAKAVGIYPGSGQVRMDVYQTPKPINTGGRWCVQIGAFHKQKDALKLKERLLKTYPGANVIEFPGEKSYWVRIRPQGDDRNMAEYIAQHTQPSEGNAYLTRLD